MFGILKSLGKLVSKAAPFASLLIPGVGPAVGAAIGGGGALLGGENPITAAAGGALGGMGNKALFGGEGLSSLLGNEMGTGAASNALGGLEKKLGSMITAPGLLGNKEGKLDLGKTIMAGTAASNLYGQSQQRKQTDKYNKASTRMTNDILSQLLSPGPGLGSNPSVMQYGQLPQ